MCVRCTQVINRRKDSKDEDKEKKSLITKKLKILICCTYMEESTHNGRVWSVTRTENWKCDQIHAKTDQELEGNLNRF